MSGKWVKLDEKSSEQIGLPLDFWTFYRQYSAFWSRKREEFTEEKWESDFYMDDAGACWINRGFFAILKTLQAGLDKGESVTFTPRDRPASGCELENEND